MPTKLKTEQILVLGAGNFGTCLSIHLAKQGHDVIVWTREADIVEGINEYHRNPRYLSSFELPPNLKAANQFSDISFPKIHSIVLAIPCQALRSVLVDLKPFIEDHHHLINVAKGIEISTLSLPSEIITDVLGEDAIHRMVALSGPSFATEVAEGQPSCVSAASYSLEQAQHAQRIFHSPFFRVYASLDPVGLEIAGAIKNVIAIAAGACAGLGFRANSQAALITRGLAEITRLGVALSADPMTFTGLGGVGDLFLTCTSAESRNYRVGWGMAQGKTLEAVLTELGSVAEGVSTARAAYQLGKQLNVAIPITEAVYQVLYESKPVKQALHDLTTRDASREDQIIRAPHRRS